MRKALIGLMALFGIGALYLTLAPVPIEPENWDAPENAGYVGDFAPNRDLVNLERIELPESPGPEDAVAFDGYIFATSQTGDISRIDPDTGEVKVVANTGGVPLGIEAYDSLLYIADAHKGLLELGGAVRSLSDTVNGSPILYADDLDISKNGIVYFSDASTKFGAQANGSTMAASLLEIMESKGTGRVLAYDLASEQTTIIADNLVFPNGVAMHPDGDILVTETGRYRVLKINPETGAMTDWIANLPGFPDNINRGPDGTFLLGLISPRSDWLDANASKPAMRKLAMRLPPSMRPKAEHYGHIVQLDAGGNVLRTFQDPDGAYHDATGAIFHDGMLYVTSLHEDALARMPYPELN
ncbi:SMP-30/gluconolactonase/LRE family protein [Litorimonas sp. WD9-15]|uniref:SMP-30/gluconolactonase/LRE family protein n=1 Tax=Litorimonas sp. WD9-15 TaxID=3418716 RepID=UPI003D068FA2